MSVFFFFSFFEMILFLRMEDMGMKREQRRRNSNVYIIYRFAEVVLFYIY